MESPLQKICKLIHEFTAFCVLEKVSDIMWAAFLIGLSHFLQDFAADRRCIHVEQSDDMPEAAVRRQVQEQM